MRIRADLVDLVNIGNVSKHIKTKGTMTFASQINRLAVFELIIAFIVGLFF